MKLSASIATTAVTVMATIGSLAASGPAHATPSKEHIRAAAGQEPLSADCYTSGGKLYCSNVAHTPMYEHRSYSSRRVEYLETPWSTFNCWGYGDQHSGGNDIWYWAQGDVVGDWGNVPASVVFTPYDPPAGMDQC
ncbi:hypothetical protein [Streptomyces beigongshangae]|uniref:hypothetical protein n=1 Tax=Streptomyces beigongshangae TaxID=2841597 RepID=UPI001C84C97E|nr:hypothetical protein [Streptomyces sp. REN17]